MSSLKQNLIEWAIENSNREFYDYLTSCKPSYKQMLAYYNGILKG